jgi:hypothetical protein
VFSCHKSYSGRVLCGTASQACPGGTAADGDHCCDRCKQVFGTTVDAVRRAFTDFGRAVPEEEVRARSLGARDLDPPR